MLRVYIQRFVYNMPYRHHSGQVYAPKTLSDYTGQHYSYTGFRFAKDGICLQNHFC